MVRIQVNESSVRPSNYDNSLISFFFFSSIANFPKRQKITFLDVMPRTRVVLFGEVRPRTCHQVEHGEDLGEEQGPFLADYGAFSVGSTERPWFVLDPVCSVKEFLLVGILLG